MSARSAVAEETISPPVASRHPRWLAGAIQSTFGLARGRPVASVFVIALAARVMVAVVLSLVSPDSVAPDGVMYSDIAAEKAAGDTDDWDGVRHSLYDSAATFLIPLTTVYRLFGPVELLGQLLVAVAGASVAAIVCRLTLERLEVRWALTAGLVVALFPSQVLWSSVLGKDAFVWAAVAALALVVALGQASSGWRLLTLGALAALLLFLLGNLRDHTFVIATWAVVAAAWIGRSAWRTQRGVGAIVLALLIPWLVGLGPVGINVVTDTGSLEARRLRESTGATALLEGRERSDDREEAFSGEFDGSVSREIGYLPKGLTVMLLRPYPWQSPSNYRLQLARAENLLWYPLLLLAIVGTFAMRRHLRLVVFPLLVAGGTVVVYALGEGNFGTAFRHRGEVLWAVAFLGLVGAHALWGRWQERRSSEASDSRCTVTAMSEPAGA